MIKKICIIDNYDSFTFNIVHYFESLECSVIVISNDDNDAFSQIERYHPSHIVLSPGPGLPKNSGNLFSIIEYFFDTIPMLGVCLGHQAIAEVFGSSLILAQSIMHGKTSQILHSGSGLFDKIKSPFSAMRYHSWVIDPSCFPSCFQIEAIHSSEIEDNLHFDDALAYTYEIMAFRHKEYPLFGVQFHPESIATQFGYALFENFLQIGQKHENV